MSLNADGKPIQKFHWNDYDVIPGRDYIYSICRMTKNQTSSSSKSKYTNYGSPLQVSISTEPDPSLAKHGIYFNRGAAPSHAYLSKFGEYRKYHLVDKFGTLEWKSIINPRSIPSPEKSKEALAWLSRGLEEALLQFLSQVTQPGSEYQLRAAVYEFTHEETIQAFAKAVERGVDVKIIRHCKGKIKNMTMQTKNANTIFSRFNNRLFAVSGLIILLTTNIQFSYFGSVSHRFISSQSASK